MRRSNEKRAGSAILAEALSDWKTAEKGEGRLSGHVRERILDTVGPNPVQRVRFAPQTVLFTPLSRLALAAAAPMMVLTLAVGYLLMPATAPAPGVVAAADSTNLEVIRQGEEVVFLIANGKTTHFVYKSTQITELQRAQPVVVSDGVFRDRIDQSANLVFYRVD
jgi:hypothetical protein